jgi:hypothetical protein
MKFHCYNDRYFPSLKLWGKAGQDVEIPDNAPEAKPVKAAAVPVTPPAAPAAPAAAADTTKAGA